MMRVYSTIVLAVAVFGCGGIQTLDPEGSNDGDHEGVAVSASSVCGLSCAPGLHPSSVFCNPACGSCSSSLPFNAVTCDFDQGTSFASCNNSCPSGYHPTAHTCSSSCGSCSFASPTNTAICALNAGTSFASCDLSCPSGYQATSFVCNSSCGTCDFANPTNEAICTATTSPCSLAEGPTTVALNGGFDFTISSTVGIPAGISSFWYGTKNGVPDAVRVPTGGTAGSFLFTNVAGINGNYVRWAQFEDAQGHLFCKTNSQSASLLP
jgi:hypothetical protein